MQVASVAGVFGDRAAVWCGTVQQVAKCGKNGRKVAVVFTQRLQRLPLTHGIFA
jgi:hypothetical protein